MDQDGRMNPPDKPTIPQYPATLQPLPPQDSQPINTVTPPQTDKPQRRKLLWFVLILVALLGSYAAVDALTDVKLPYEFFKKGTIETPKTAATQSSQNESSFQLPEGWVWYENKDLGFKFAYPKVWGLVSIQDNAESIAEGNEKGKSYQFSFSVEPNVKVGAQEKNWEFLLGGRGGPCEAVGFTKYTPYKAERYEESETRLIVDREDRQVRESYSTGGMCGGFDIWGQKKFTKNNLFSGIDYSYSNDSIAAPSNIDVEEYRKNPNSVFPASARQVYVDFVNYIQEL